MITFKVFVCVALGLLGILLDGVEGQTVVVLEGGTATFNDVTVPGTGGTVVSTAGGQQVMQLDIFGSTVFPAFQNRVTVTSFNNGFRDGRSSFVIRNVQKSDAGNFQCQSQFEGQQPCGSATLVVAGAPTKPTLNVLTDPIIVGNDVIVECQSTSTSVPASSALKLAYNLKENGRLALPQPTTASRFKISSISKAKKGARYSCIAYEQNTLSNQLTGLQSTDSDVYIMDPLYPPEELLFDPPRANYAVSSSETLPEVTCTADCNPACTFDWYKGSQIFQAGDRLSLGTADKNNAGNYFCRATNNIGNKDKPLIITVEDSVSTPTLIPPTSEYNVPEGTNVDDIFCRAECTPECTYTWLKDGQRLLGSQGIRLGTVGPSSSGRYTCRASNGEDLSEVSFDLDVQYPPKDLPGRELISPSTSRYQVEEGALVLPDISCNADCNPPCTVQWTKAGVGPYGPGSVLSLGAASRDDTGTYTCTANNTLGQTTTNVEVLIEFRPEQLTLTPPGTLYNSVEGDDAIPDVRCSAVCNPDCDYEWYKGDGGAPLSDTAVISLGTAARAYDGTYTCRASNKVGEDVISFDVSVLYGPEKATIEPPQGSYKVPTGTLLPSVTCSADCNPGCSYRWVKDDSLQPITTLRTLTLGQAEPNTNGIYKCLASNDYGSADTKFDLAVQFGPSSTVQLQPPQSSHDLSEGDDLTVTCDATCDPPCNFRWEDTSGSAVAGSKTLKLTDVTRANAGTYTCVADNGVGTPARRPVNVNVLIGPSGRVTITPAGPVISLKQGNSFVLTCSAECSPVCTYKWLKDTQELPSRNGILTLNDVNRNQNGAYTCEATNVVGLGAKDIVLDIKYGPGNSVSFTPDKASHSAEENSDLSVTCSADCKPECEYVWKRGLTEVALTPVLYLEAIQRKQAGTYSCTANNEVSQPSTQQISVDVLYGPAEVRMFPDEAQLYPVKGSSTSLKCWATCNPECTYIWYKGSSIVPDSVDGELDLRNVTTETSGNYLCVASNNVGEPATRSVEINVRAGPGTTIRFSPPDDTPIVMEGRQFQVKCIAECSPPCTYEWRKGSQKLTNRSVLEFPETDRKKAGSYICFASNDANSQASKPLTLEVTFGPGNSIHLFPPDQNQSYAVGVPFNIKCAAECDPECTYKWFLGPKLLPYDDGVLFSDAARMDQAGTYTCVASNGIGGATTKSVTIDVHAGPGTSLNFTPPGSKQVLKEGGSLSVTCSADCNPPCTYMWMFNEEEIPTSRGRLELSNVGREEKGVYSCLADNGLGNQGRKPLNVEVQYGPEGAIDIFPADGTQVLNEGASLALKCSADCSPDCSYTWFLGNEVIGSKDGVLSLVAVGPENAGTYRCSAENSIGLSSSEVVTVVVQTGPGNTVKIEPSGDVNNVTEGEQLEMRCSAVCSPPCTYTWYFGVERVKSDDGVLTIDEVPRNMSGPFVCYAANDVGLQGSRLIKVDIQYGPTDGIDLDPANNVTVVAGSPFYLRCSANCDPPCKYTWYQGPLPRESEGGRLAIRKAAEGDGGSFTCRARNVVGSLVSDVVDVEVQYGPRDEIELDPPGPTYVVQEGDDVTVTCSADCKPGCKYSWFAGSEQVDSNNGKLVIENYQRSMPRFYSCFADNGLSTRVMAPLQVEVHYGPGKKPALFPDTSPLAATVGGSVSVQCSAECSPECTYTWTKDGQEVATTAPGVLQLRGLRPEQAGTYLCSAGNGIGTGPATASVDVELQSGPGASIRFIPAGLTKTVKEGGTLQVTCAADCVPDCTFSWIKDGQQVSSRSLLLLTNAQRIQEGVYECNAKNPLGVNVTQQLTVDVEHGPGTTIKLFPPQDTRDLSRGDTLSVQCSALCTPPCNYVWRKGTDELTTKEGVLLLPNVTPDDRGRYTCTAENGKGSSASANLNVNVNFGPEDTVTFEPPGDSKALVEGNTLEVKCSAQCLPACSYTWYLASRRLNTTSGQLVIPAVTRQDAGSYTCHADNGVGRRMTHELLVDIEFPPNTPTFDPATTAYTLRERIDSVSDIRCYADCNPRCAIQWLKNGQPLDTVSNVLALPTPDRSADGTYTCVASNVHGSRQKDLTITVNYAPAIAIFTINDRKTEATVPEKYPVTLNCRVSSRPPSNIKLFNGTDLIVEVKNTLQAKHSWKQAECLDAGKYSCTADNGVGALVSVSAELKVLCPPRLDPRVFKLLLVAAEQGQTAVITVPVLGNPPPSFLWYKIRNGVPSVILEGTNSTQGQSDKFFTVNGTSSTLTIENVQLADFGDYVISMANSRGNNNITFSLVPQSAPYKTRNLTARPIDAHTVEVTWSPGFNGGAKQQFLLEYLKQGTNGWRTLELDPRINDVTRAIRLNVSDLNPSTPYSFRVRSRNIFGLSNYSNEAKVLTPASPDFVVSSGEVNPTPVLLGVGLALGFLVGAGITAIVVVSRCRPKTGKNGENTIDDFRSDTTYDTLYLRDALWAQRHIKMRQNGGGMDTMDGYDYKQPQDTMRTSL